MWQRRRQSVGKGVAAGVVGGLVASWAMSQFLAAVKKLKSRGEEPERAEPHAGERPEQAEPKADEAPATIQVATAVTRQVLRRELQGERLGAAGEVVHYVFGAAVGGLYGAAAEVWPEARLGSGAVFGALLWLAADEIGVPALKFSKGPVEYPVSVHASGLGAHIVYGVATELLRRGLREGVLAA